MTRQARVGMVLGLAFIIAFGLALSEIRNVSAPRQDADEAFNDSTYYRQPDSRAQEFALGPEPVPIRPVHYATGQSPRPQVARQDNAGLHRATIRRREDNDVVRPQLAAPLPPVADDTQVATGQAPTQSGQSDMRVYVVKENDALYGIAQAVYGRNNGHLFKRIYEANRDQLRSPEDIHPGQRLRIPPAEGSAGPAYREMDLDQLRQYVRTEQPRRARVYVVQPGDNLTAIARKVYRDDSPETVRKLFDANQDQLDNPNSLTRGMRLKVPG